MAIARKHNLIIPLGLLHNLNHMLSGMAFIQLSKTADKTKTGQILDPDKINKLMLKILQCDEKFKAGTIDAKTFREEILTLLDFNPKKVSDEEFDKAWNAMQQSF